MEEIARFYSDDLVPFYTTNLRASLFTGFMTLTGFLFTLHTFLLVTLHRDIYGTEDYQKSVIQVSRKLNPKLRPLGPLRNVGKILFGMLCLAFATAISQLSIGLVKAPWASAFCIGMAVATVIAFALTLLAFRTVISDWLDYVEDKAERLYADNPK